MRAEEMTFLALMRDFSGGGEAELPDGLDWEALYEIAKGQSLIGLCYVVLRDRGASSETLERFHPGFYSEVYHAANRAACMVAFAEKAAEQGIALLPFKGWAVKDCWPVPALRTMGDLDVLIHTEDREGTDAIMKALGYARFIDNHAVWTYTERDVMFELHDHMFYEYLANDFDYRGYFDHAWERGREPGFQLCFLLTHMAKHITNSGLGFRWIWSSFAGPTIRWTGRASRRSWKPCACAASRPAALPSAGLGSAMNPHWRSGSWTRPLRPSSRKRCSGMECSA